MADRENVSGKHVPNQPMAASLGVRAVGGVGGWLLNRSAGVRRGWLIGYWSLIFFLTHWPKISDFPGALWLPPHFDLVVHFCIYAGWAAAWWWVLAGNRPVIQSWMTRRLLIGGAVYGVFDELTQAIVQREPDAIDWLADMAGIILALLLLGWWWRRLAVR